MIEHVGGLDAVLVADETGDLKKGMATAGVQRQYTGTAGRIENALMLRVGPRFRRVEPRRRARGFVLGLLTALPRKNCWTIAEQAGDGTPDGMQHLLSRARWDADGVRDDVGPS